MFYHHPLAQALPPRLGLVMGAGVLLQSFFGLDADTPRPSPTDALRAQGTGLTTGLGKKKLAPSTFFPRPVVRPVPCARNASVGEGRGVSASKPKNDCSNTPAPITRPRRGGRACASGWW